MKKENNTLKPRDNGSTLLDYSMSKMKEEVIDKKTPKEEALKMFKYKKLKNIEIEELTFALEQGKIFLDSIDRVFSSTMQKAFTLLGIFTTALTASVAYFILNNKLDGVFSPRLFVVACIIPMIFYVCFLLSKNVTMSKYRNLGCPPSDTLNSYYYTLEDKTYRLKNMMFAELVNIQINIKTNGEGHIERSENIDSAINAFVFIPVVALSMYLVVTVFLLWL